MIQEISTPQDRSCTSHQFPRQGVITGHGACWVDFYFVWVGWDVRGHKESSRCSIDRTPKTRTVSHSVMQCDLEHYGQDAWKKNKQFICGIHQREQQRNSKCVFWDFRFETLQRERVSSDILFICILHTDLSATFGILTIYGQREIVTQMATISSHHTRPAHRR